jgi:hypothetical protein
MHTHDTEFEDGLRPKAGRIDPVMDAGPSPTMMRAAAMGRSDVLDGPAVLGLQRAVGNAGVGAMLEQDKQDDDSPSPVQNVVNSGGGSPMPKELRTDMESRLGHDFSDVKIHTDAAADHSARSVSAHAYTVGNNVVFQRDKYDPSSTEGKTMLAHELTHVVQQRSGPVDGSDAPGGIKVSDPSDRFEREAASTAEVAMSASSGAHGETATTAGPATGSTGVQRDEEEELPEEGQPVAQGSFVQREEDEQPEEEAVG